MEMMSAATWVWELFALPFSAVWVAVLMGLAASLVLSTFARPTEALSCACHVLSPRQYCAVVPAAMVGSLALRAVCVAVEMGLEASLVLSTLARPTSVLVKRPQLATVGRMRYSQERSLLALGAVKGEPLSCSA